MLPRSPRARSAVAVVFALVCGLSIAPTPATAAASVPARPVQPRPAATQFMAVQAGTATAPSDRRGPQRLPEPCEPGMPCDEGATCLYGFDRSITSGSNPEYGSGPSYRIEFDGHVSCWGAEVYQSGSADLVDRTPGYDGAVRGSGYSFTGYDNSRSSGTAELFEDDFPAGQQVEVVLTVRLLTFSQVPWAGCYGPRVLRCDGIGTNELVAVLGGEPFASGVVAADCDHKDDPTIEFRSTQDAVRAKLTAHLMWCTYSDGRVKEVRPYKAAERYFNPDDLAPAVTVVRFDESGEPERGYQEAGRGHYKLTVLVGINGHSFPWCRMTIHGVYIGGNADHSEDVNNCSNYYRGG